MIRRFTRKKDSPDPRDYRYVNQKDGFLSREPPTKVDLRSMLPPAFDQGEEGSCGPNSASAFMCFLKQTMDIFSRNQIYYSVRLIEDDVKQDAGVETRDLFKILNQVGAAPESIWPYVQSNLYVQPPNFVLEEAGKNIISTYFRLIAEDDFVGCLSEGFPFVLGFNVYDSLMSDAIARNGIMQIPDIKREQIQGGHDVLVVGYDLKFRSSAVFKNSGVDTTLVSDHALLIRNSWGHTWGIQGHFWMPMSYAINPSTGGDAWTGRL